MPQPDEEPRRLGTCRPQGGFFEPIKVMESTSVREARGGFWNVTQGRFGWGGPLAGVAKVFIGLGIFGLGLFSARAEEVSKLPPAAGGAVSFARDIRPVLEKFCFECHGPEKQKSDFRLDLGRDALRGGHHGVAIVPGDSAKSPLIHAVAGLWEDMLMPPKGEKLSAAQIGLLRAWIDQGASWPEEEGKGDDRFGFWSLRPLVQPPVPKMEGADLARVRTPVDAFVGAKLKEKGLAPSGEADARVLARRVYFDLTGLPPSAEEVDGFVRDEDPQAYENLVERLLASPGYGERWARHWLDVVHYGDTHGYDKDKPRPNAWPYRDYVIRAFNEDKPYSRFVREQLAGDVLFPWTVDGLVATGFISAGPWDFIGHAEVPEEKIDGRVARHLDRDDMVSNTMNTFISMTVQCARCHNHKFDPVTQEDYYGMQAVFAALDRADRSFDADPEVGKVRMELQQRRKELEEEKKGIEKEIARLGGAEMEALESKIKQAQEALKGDANPAFGYHSAIEATADAVKWVQVDLGALKTVQRIQLVGAHDDFNVIGAGFGFPRRYRVEMAADEKFESEVVLARDEMAADVQNPGVAPQTAEAGGKTARFVRVTATKLAPRQNDYIFALAELQVLDAEGKNLALKAGVTALDSIEQPARWAKQNLVDGVYRGAKGAPATQEQLASLEGERERLVAARVPEAMKIRRVEVAASLAQVEGELKKLPPMMKVYSGMVHHGSGAFRGTGADGGKPRLIQVLNRGDVEQPRKAVGPGAVPIFEGDSARFELGEGHSEGERRARLAEWIVDRRNPLTWRSIVNRVWLYHFGRGIADSPNDFGRMGQPPSHPELLDWLAVEFRDGGQSLKQLHRLLVLSATYRQSSAGNAVAEKVDANNQYLWRMNRRRLEAEAIRDSALFVSGKLDRTMYGPGFEDFVIEKPEHSPHYQYHLHDPENVKTHRRSVYRFIVRSQQQPFMTTLDCADPSMLVDKRNESLSALQALALLNNPFMVSMAKHLAARVEAVDGGLERQVDAAFRRALSRSPKEAEKKAVAEYAARHGLANACRLILNLNEFIFVD